MQYNNVETRCAFPFGITDKRAHESASQIEIKEQKLWFGYF